MSALQAIEAMEASFDAAVDAMLARITAMIGECPPEYVGQERRS